MTKTEIAIVSHEMNKAYCESIGDNSQTSWADAPDWQKSSAIMGVQFHIDNPDASPSASHESWLKQKEADGWKYGPVKHEETKEHPCYVPYDELPVAQRSKDFIFKQTVHSLKKFLSPTSDVQTEGEYRVRANFNVTKSPLIDGIKHQAANLINLVDMMQIDKELNAKDASSFGRLKSMAMTEIESGCSWAVKAATV